MDAKIKNFLHNVDAEGLATPRCAKVIAGDAGLPYRKTLARLKALGLVSFTQGNSTLYGLPSLHAEGCYEGTPQW